MDTSSIVWTTQDANGAADNPCLSVVSNRSDTARQSGFDLLERIRKWRTHSIYRARKHGSAVILGTQGPLERIHAASRIRGCNSLPPLIVSITDPESGDWGRSALDIIDNLVSVSRVDHLIVALPLPRDGQTESVFGRVVDLGALVSLIDSDATQSIGADNPQTSRRVLARRARYAMKETIDRGGAALLLVLLSPLLLFLTFLIRATSKGPALFVQPRLGRHNAIISVVKFRTMYVDRGDPSGGRRTIPNDPRVTPLGRILRRWSLDELPQLFNVLAGQMSLVGPRPHAVMMKAGDRLYFEAVPGYLNRHRVKPGITGWAQVNRLSGQVDSVTAGYNRLMHDLHYIDNWSIWLDLKIFWKTFRLFFDRVNRY